MRALILVAPPTTTDGGTDGPDNVEDSDAGLEWFLRNDPDSGPVDVQFSFGPKGVMPMVGD